MLPMLSIMYTKTTPPCCKKNCCSLLVSVDSDGGYSMGLGLGTVSPREDTTVPGFRLNFTRANFFSTSLLCSHSQQGGSHYNQAHHRGGGNLDMMNQVLILEI